MIIVAIVASPNVCNVWWYAGGNEFANNYIGHKSSNVLSLRFLGECEMSSKIGGGIAQRIDHRNLVHAARLITSGKTRASRGSEAW